MPSPLDLTAVDRTTGTLTERLRAARTAAGHWQGRLSSSALATATATMALMIAGRAAAVRDPLVERGLGWLVAHQNRDGGWGDTAHSISNLSTTALCWAALSHGEERHPGARAAVAQARRWLEREIGTLAPRALRRALLARYGRDRTFSVPILTVLALAGQLGEGPRAWRRVPQLPFELAMLPHSWFRIVRLPVVSYALPALVAMGHVRHARAPTRNPVLAALRSALRGPTLRVARGMQPYSGGFLEATPLTAFVVMSLADAGSADEPVVMHGVRFLRASARPDGSWPIDTNLATWVSTLAVDALGPERLRADEQQAIRAWLLQQQTREEHPFTRAAPGGWAWTDLSGGVPDADDTAGALVALRMLGGAESAAAAVSGIGWLLDLQNRDGGVPTFCRGWGALPFDRSASDLTAHAIKAWSLWHEALPRDLQERVHQATARALAFLMRRQAADGSWTPLWFGNQHAPGETNATYGTARVVSALAVALGREQAAGETCVRRGVAWLLRAQAADGGWGGAPGVTSSIEETGVALHALASVGAAAHDEAIVDAVAQGAAWLVRTTREGRDTPASPIGLYFARLWYDEELYPVVFPLKGLLQARIALADSP